MTSTKYCININFYKDGEFKYSYLYSNNNKEHYFKSKKQGLSFFKKNLKSILAQAKKYQTPDNFDKVITSLTESARIRGLYFHTPSRNIKVEEVVLYENNDWKDVNDLVINKSEKIR